MKRQSGIGENFLRPSLPSGSNSTICLWSSSSWPMYSLIVCCAFATSPLRSSMFAFIAIARPKYTGRSISHSSWSTIFFAGSRNGLRFLTSFSSVASLRYISAVSLATLHHVFASSSLFFLLMSLRSPS